MKSIRLTPCAAAVAAAVLQMTSPAQAATCTLTNNGLWQTPGDWSCNQEPGAGDSATINLNGLVTINQAEQITTLSNAGTINISAFGLTLLSGGGTTNSGTINVGGATTANLTDQSNNINNAGGTINIANGSAMNVFGSTVSGGTIATTGTGAMTLYNSSTLDGATQGAMTLSGNVSVAGGQTGYFYGTFNQTGNLVVGDGANGTDFRVAGNNNAALNGAGTLTLTASSRVFGDTGNDGLTNGSGHTIQGAGQLGINQLYVTNNGLVNANVSGGTLQIDPTDGAIGSEGFANNGTIRASNGGNAQLLFAYYNNATGTIEAQTGSTVTITNGAAVEGGTLKTSGTGAINLTNSAYLDGGTRGAITINGQVTDVAGQTAYASGTLSGGNLVIGDGSGNGTDFRIAGNNNLTLAGGGTLSLTNIATRIFGDNGSDGLTNSLGNTIQGAGQVGINQMYVVNNGLITANLGGQTLQLDPTDGANGAEGFINTGTLRAENGGNLSLLYGFYKNAGATITAADRLDSQPVQQRRHRRRDAQHGGYRHDHAQQQRHARRPDLRRDEPDRQRPRRRRPDRLRDRHAQYQQPDDRRRVGQRHRLPHLRQQQPDLRQQRHGLADKRQRSHLRRQRQRPPDQQRGQHDPGRGADRHQPTVRRQQRPDHRQPQRADPCTRPDRRLQRRGRLRQHRDAARRERRQPRVLHGLLQERRRDDHRLERVDRQPLQQRGHRRRRRSAPSAPARSRSTTASRSTARPTAR